MGAVGGGGRQKFLVLLNSDTKFSIQKDRRVRNSDTIEYRHFGSFFALSANIHLIENFELNCLSGAIPMLNQVMSATRGATDALSGVSRHVNDTVSQTPSSYMFTAKFGVVI